MLVKKRIFVHIPKNAGCTVRLNPELNQYIIEASPDTHLSKEYTKNLLQTMSAIGDHHGFAHARWKDFNVSLRNQYQAFTIVRNPWARVVSRYFFAKKTIEHEKKNPIGYADISSFEAFLEERHKWGNQPFMWHRAIRGWYNQVDYVTDGDGNIKCDILRQEKLEFDIKSYLKIMEMPRARNVTGLISDYKSMYTPQTIQIVADWFKPDIDIFGFDFDTTATKNIWNKI
jgi:hypothetical protein